MSYPASKVTGISKPADRGRSGQKNPAGAVPAGWGCYNFLQISSVPGLLWQ